LQECKSKLADAQDSFENAKSRGIVFSKLKQCQKNGTIKGICGRLGDLGTIDDRYDVAVTTACSALDSIVVETVESGQNCIEYLKKNNLGRGTFLCLDKIRGFDSNPISTPEAAPRLVDLIQPLEPRFKAAFYHALGNTLVAKNLEQANRIAYGATRFRVVTLDGQLIDKSGTMSGGGNRVLKGGMSSKQKNEYSASDVATLESNFADAEASVNSLTSQLRVIQNDIKKSKLEFDNIENDISRTQLDIKSYNDELLDAETALRLAKSLYFNVGKMQIQTRPMLSVCANLMHLWTLPKVNFRNSKCNLQKLKRN
jgi:structural maintenance of chromosome 4